MNKKIEIFRAGKQTDSKGNTKVWSEADLDKIVEKYSEGKHEAPLVIGHPKTDDPAFGWVKKVFRKGKTLFAEVGDVVEDFKEAVNKGLYKKRSISLYPDFTLKHVGFLGAMPPAVKGLADFKFQAEEEETLDFEIAPEQGEESEFADFETAWGFRDIGRVFRSLREHFIAQGMKEQADEIFPNYTVKGLEDFKETDSKKAEISPRSSFEENQNKGENEMNLEEALAKIEELEGKSSEFCEKIETLESEVEAANKRADEAEASLANFQEEAEEKEIAAFCEDLVAKGKLAAEDVTLTKKTLSTLKKSGETLQFGEGDDKEEVSAFDQMKKKLSGASASVTTEEFASGEDASGAQSYGDKELEEFSENGALDEESSEEFRAIKKIEKEKGISFAEARREYLDAES